MLADSGATSNVIGKKLWYRARAGELKCYSYVPKEQRNTVSHPVTVKGAFKYKITIGNRTREFIVIKGNGEPLLGKKTAMKLGVLKIGRNISAVTDIKYTPQQQYPNVFKGVRSLNTKQPINRPKGETCGPATRIPYNL